MELLHIKNLEFTYPDEKEKALKGVDLTVEQGEFIVICGQSGCGKTTLLRLLKREIAPAGEQSGTILYDGTKLSNLEDRTAACEIGYVMQNPESQIVMDKVWHELAFGLENMGISTPEIRRRVGEMASFFGIQTWFRNQTADLSGGQKQLLNLASIMVMHPKVLILDEPTSQLDPIGASEFIATLQKLNKELGLTILLVEHRLEDVFPIADKVVVMEQGRVILCDTPENVGQELKCVSQEHQMLMGLPSAVRIYNQLNVDDACPLTVRDGRGFLSRNFKKDRARLNVVKRKAEENGEAIVRLKEAWFRYERDLPDVLRGVDLEVYSGETFCILGGNGTGKTTTLKVISGQARAYRGKVEIQGKNIKEYKGIELYRHNIALLPQNPQSAFVKSTVEEDLNEVCKAMNYNKDEGKKFIADIIEKLGISHLVQKHPYDLSGGEQQKAALAKMLLLKPKILLLDEPTKGIDAYSKQVLRTILTDLKEQGITVIIVTHDVEFAALCADRCAMFFDGEVVSVDEPNTFFASNTFYTTAASRISRHMFENAVTCEDVVALCLENGLKERSNQLGA
ncbi:ABC transporter ATP-binding protein [Anaerovorax sp. IOR16]|uniref:ABC transporter ATP-binding protein n=1 Tax=Anaerovorax sp. IOR16 TaxID=2773458 RepID=UPI0019D041CC|nr:ABC transporter ATP-binding protein [Anaerovorax sp. IOR16]